MIDIDIEETDWNTYLNTTRQGPTWEARDPFIYGQMLELEEEERQGIRIEAELKLAGLRALLAQNSTRLPSKYGRRKAALTAERVIRGWDNKIRSLAELSALNQDGDAWMRFISFVIGKVNETLGEKE